MFTFTQRVARIVVVNTAGVMLLGSVAMLWFGHGIHSETRTVPSSIAFWMEHSWSTALPPSWALLEEKLKELPIDTLYFHVGPLSESGQLASDLSIPSEKLTSLGTTNYAWIGQIRSKINLYDTRVRANILSSARQVLSQGFEGIHLDIEPVKADDLDFLTLVQELRVGLPNARISIAMDEWQPALFSEWIGLLYQVPVESYWTTRQVKMLAPYVDELVVMTYDTRLHSPQLYSWWVEQQTVALSRIVPSSVKVRIGIPAYDKGASFDPVAENIQTGLAGFQRGVQNLRSQPTALSGLAIYAYWEMDNAEWATLTP